MPPALDDIRTRNARIWKLVTRAGYQGGQSAAAAKAMSRLADAFLTGPIAADARRKRRPRRVAPTTY